jgi:aryl-alcohol dehydrogenase (NADP+)
VARPEDDYDATPFLPERRSLGVAGLHLGAEETARLDEASDPGAADYPYGGPGTQQRSRALPG